MIHPVIILLCALILPVECLTANAEQGTMEMELIVVMVGILTLNSAHSIIIIFIITVSPIITYGTLGAVSFLLLIAIVITVTVICLRRCYMRHSSYDVKAKDNP